MEEMNLRKWAKKEMDLATAQVSFGAPDETKKEIFKYYEEAFLAYCDFLDHMEKLDRSDLSKTIFRQLLNEDPLVPIEDNDIDWVVIEGFDPSHDNASPGWSIYQCKRRSSLFKKVIYNKETGEIERTKYSDAERYICIDINTERVYSGGMGPVVLDELIPITMPYFPTGKIKIFTEEFKAYEDTGDFDTIGVLYCRLTDGRIKEIKRFFKENHETYKMVEIDRNEYLARKKKTEGRKQKQLNQIFDDVRRSNQ